MIHVNPKYAAPQIAQILAADPVIRIGRAVTCGNVEHPVMAEHDPSAVVPLRMPFDDDML